MARTAARTLVPIEQALAALLGIAAPVDPIELPAAEALGCILAEPLRAPASVPPVAIARRAGFALRAADTFGTSSYAPLLLPHMPVRVAGGEPLPPGTDAVVDAESVQLAGSGAEISEAVAPGAWTRRAGEEAASGTSLRAAGQPLRALDLAAARAAGIRHVQVRRPRLLLIEAAADPMTLACCDLVAAVAARAGAAILRVEAEGLRDQDADIVAAVGPADGLRSALAPGAVILADRLAMRPGEDGALARIGATPLTLIPAQPDAALSIALTLLGPALAALAGAAPAAPAYPLPLTRKIASTIGFTEIVLLRLTGGGWEPIAGGDLPLSAITTADGWLLVQPGQEGFPAGHVVAGTLL